MSLGDFWLQFNNGKKLDLNNLKSGINKKDVDKKFHSLFDVLDADNNKILTNEEAGLLYNLATLIAGEDKKLSEAEEKNLFGFLGIDSNEKLDLAEFIQKFDKIADSKEGYYADGTRVVQTTYANGKIETLILYPDGGVKFKEVKTPKQSINSPEIVPVYTKYDVEREYSERAKADLQEQSMDWILDHVNENIKMISDYKTGEGFLKKSTESVMNLFGKSLDSVQEELIEQQYLARNSDLSLYNQRLGGLFTPEKYEAFLETDSKYMNARFWKSQTDELQKGLKSLRSAIQGEINREKLASRQNSSNTIGLADAYNKKVPTQKRDSEIIFAEIFNKYCAGNKQLAQQLMTEIAGDITSSKQLTHEKMLEVADKLEKISQQLLKDNLGGETYEGLEKRFQSEYKSLYGKEDYTDYIQDRMMKIEGWAGMEKIAIITITQILIGILSGGSSVAAEGVASTALAAGGRAAGKGLVTKFMASQAAQKLVVTYGEAKVMRWAQQAMKFLMLTGTVVEDVGLGFLDAATSEDGITWEKSNELLKQGLSSAKYIYFGGYLSGPVASFVGSKIKTASAVAMAFKGGTKVTQGAVTTTTITADKFISSMQSKAIKFMAGTASLGTEIGAFALLDLATEDVGIKGALSGSADMQIKLKVMNRLLETLLGGLVNKISSGKAAAMPKLDAEIEKALKDKALKNLNVVERKTPTGTLYSIEGDGKILCSAKDPNMLVVSLTSYLASTMNMAAIVKEMEEMETEVKTAETKPKQKVESEVKPENTKIETGKNSDLVNEFDAYIKGLAEHGEDYVPEFMDKASPLFKEYFDFRKEFIRSQREIGKTIKISDRRGYLKDIENFILTKSQIATREDYVKITDEIAKLMTEYVKTKYPNIRPEIAENADKIYKWKAAMSGQRAGEIPDANGKYPITTDKFFDAKAHDKAVEEFTAFLEEMTGKKVLVDNTAIFGTFIGQLGFFNNPDFYKEVDYIVLGHGTGSSLVTDLSAPNAWKFKYSGQPVWDFIAKNVPEGKKALLLVCEHDGKTPIERKKMPEMYDDNGIYMKGIGDVVTGDNTFPAKIVVGGINHIIGTIGCKYLSGPSELVYGIGGDVTTKYYSIDSKVKNNKANETGIKEETKSTVEVKPDESASAGNRTNDKISPELMAEFEHYASENNLKLTISKHGNVVFRDNDGKIVRRVDIDENGNVREDKEFITDDKNASQIDFMEKDAVSNDEALLQKITMLNKQIQEHNNISKLSDKDRFMLFLQKHNPKIYDRIKKNPLLLETPKYKEMIADCKKLDELDFIIAKCRYSDAEEANAVYEDYLKNEYVSENPKTAEHIKDLCRQINKDLGVKVFLPANLKESGVALKLIYQELACYKMHAESYGEKAELPPTLEFFTSEVIFIERESRMGGCYSSDNKDVIINGLSVETIKECLRHELAHANDRKLLQEFPEGFNPQQYEQIFRDAHISDHYIEYGQTSPKEFIAVAAQGDMSKYPPKLREALKSLGMPEWMLNMPAKFSQADIDKVTKANKEFKNTNFYAKFAKVIFGNSKDSAIDYCDSPDSSTPQIVTTEAFAKHVKVPYVNSLYRLKGIVINKGKIDLSIPANKYIYDNYRPREKKVSTETYPKQEAPANLTPTGKTKRGRKSKGAEEPKKTPGTQGTTSNQTPPSKELSIADYAETLGLSENTIDLFIEKGNIVVNKDGKIDWNNPKNQEFTKSAVNLVKQLAAPKAETEQHKGQSTTSEATTPKFVSIAEFADMVGIRASNVYVLKGLIITENPQTNHKMIDINVESNKEIIRRYHVKNYAEILGLSEKTVEFYIKKGNIIVNEDGTIDLKISVNQEFTKYAMDLVGKMINHKADETPKDQLVYERNWESKSVEEKLLELGFEDAALIKDLYPEKAEKFLKALETLDLYIDKSKLNAQTSSDIFDKNEIPDILVDTKDNPIKIENLQQLFDKANMINRLNKVKQEVNKLLGGKTSSLIDGKSYNEGTFISVINGKVYTILDITDKDIITTRDLKVFSTCPVEKCKKLGISKIDTEDGLKIVMEEGKDMDLTSIQRIWDALYNSKKSLPVSIDDKNPKYPISEINFTSNSITITMRDGNKMDMSTFMTLYKHCFGENSVSSLNESSVVTAFTDNLNDILVKEFSKEPWNKTEQPVNLWYELPKMRRLWLHHDNDKFRKELPDLLTDEMWNNTCFKTYRSRLRFLEKVIMKEDIKWDGKQSRIWGYYQRKLSDHKNIADKIKQFDDMIKDKISSENLHVEKASDKSGIPCIKFRFDDKVYGIGIGECNTDEGFFIETVYRTKDFVF